MKVDAAQLSLFGDRQENQDRVRVMTGCESLLLVAIDGMGGHSEGERAAEVTVERLQESFSEVTRPIFDPQGFLIMALTRAHEAVALLAPDVALDQRPRATCAVCLVQDSGAYWAHVGDSRIYQLRGETVQERTRDHSHVELLLREGLIGEEEIKNHPMRNFVECCLGGDVVLPSMSITARRGLAPGDVLLTCTDGFWSGLTDAEIVRGIQDQAKPLEEALRALAETAVANNAPHSDNTSVAALRWMG